ncbi:ECF RNA polymerase sigma factor SigK [Gordonia sp. Z-3]|jgi:RNA polymerase sigma-70 factor (ECF subfamily)|uniref:ECF RNA polymerase sigma factor SigK n=1 Tax=Gordonia tangerina TaxID=2911060 RepID=A0ABS9DNR0_9ACTN|nr:MULTISPECIES: ECF RNA polymerase sigma factor SigK [Gordonia]MAU82314.1 RNA polymerase subunit sigma [Gordonia sp. (in: high G+C Gram-positive bacteria)]MAU84455.1 RNA polymerase subunit sigma [Gordonia sp. (in: high G+C Gram-positive bacteria)]MCF3940817.1 ECF RNA polymerase sigma factor SigK [Gordonia tangerina]MED5799510.1 ECF RNA polymerase sigma factor SigK [Gordonia sp. Z-3]
MTSTGAADDPDLLRTLLADSALGDRGAFTRLYDLTSGRVYGLALRVVRDRNYAEEIVQEAYLQFWQKADQYHPGRGSVISWMMTITHRRAVDRVRSEEVHHRKATEYESSNQAPASAVPLEIVVAREENTELRTCLNTLSVLQRDSIEMSYFGGLTYPEVAEHMSTPLPTIKTRIRDGLRKLRNCLRGRDHV